MFTTVQLSPQVIRDESELAASPFCIDMQNMRSNSGKMETTYGQELASSSLLVGVSRGGMAWADLSRQSWAVFGTHLRIEVIDQDGTLYDITPVIEYGRLSSAYTITNGSTLISVSDDNHNLAVDQKINLSASSAGNVLISGNYTVSSVNTSSTYTFYATSTANQSTAGVGPSNIDYQYFLKPGNLSNLGGYGYGTGGYGTGGYGSPGSGQDLDARTWTFANWGQNLIANPNWGAIYEWAPNVTASELVTAGDFASTATWALGSGWSVAAGTSSASAGAKISQPLSLIRSSWHLLSFDITRNSGSIQPLIGTSSVGGAITATGTYKRTFFSPVSTAQTLIFDGSSAFNGTLDNVSLKVLTTGNRIDGTPSSCGSVFVTAERNLVACGTVNANTGLLDPMLVRWSAQENNQDWTASASNVAGSYLLSHGSRIVRGLAGNRENLVFTDNAVYRMRSVPDPSVVYAFDLIAEGCGLIGPNAVVFAPNGGFYWVTPQGKFMAYGGGAASPIDNPSERDFRDNLSAVQGQKIYASVLASENKIIWFYPDARDGVECSRIHEYDYKDSTWVSGAFARTTYIDAGYFGYPLATDSDGRIYFQEKDFSSDGSARTTMLETSYFNIADGDNFATVNGIRPDFDDLKGGVAITFYSRNYPQGQTRTYGPYNITANTQRISCRIKGRQIKFKITTNDAPSFYRLGSMTFDIAPSGQKK